LDAERERNFRNTWNLAPRTASKQIERLRAFFNFCIENEWITKNPTKAIKAPEVKPSPTLPFTEDGEIAKIMANTDERSAIFFDVLLNTGLRIIDAAQLRPEKIIDGRLFLHTEKTGVPVFPPLPPQLMAELQSLPLAGGFYFATESSNPVSIAEYYRQKLLKAAVKSGDPDGRPLFESIALFKNKT
jgi:integrase